MKPALVEASLTLLRVRTRLSVCAEQDLPISRDEAASFAHDIEQASEVIMHTIYRARDLLTDGAKPI